MFNRKIRSNIQQIRKVDYYLPSWKALAKQQQKQQRGKNKQILHCQRQIDDGWKREDDRMKEKIYSCKNIPHLSEWSSRFNHIHFEWDVIESTICYWKSMVKEIVRTILDSVDAFSSFSLHCFQFFNFRILHCNRIIIWCMQREAIE